METLADGGVFGGEWGAGKRRQISWRGGVLRGAGWHLESHAGGRDLLWAFQFSSSVGPGHWRTGAVLREIFPGGLRKALITALGNHTTDLTTSSEDGGTGPFRYVGDDLRLGHRWKGGQWNRGGRASQGNRRSATVTFQESAGSDGGVPESAGKGETLLPAEPAGRPSSREIARDQKS